MTQIIKKCRNKRLEKRRKYDAKHKEEIKKSHAKYRVKHHKKILESKKLHRQTPKGIYSIYKGRAKQRNRIWDLSFEQFIAFWQQPCYYCNVEIKTIGLDRIDNQQGYYIDNVVSCCRNCNRAKKCMSQERFLSKSI